MDRRHRVEMLMGTAISIDIVGGSDSVDAEALADEAFQWFDEVDRRFSTYRADSEVSRLDRGELTIADVSRDLHQVLEACEDLRGRTSGFFDAYATGHLDPSGYVKGWSVQVVADRLRAAGVTNCCINAGGDIAVFGMGPDGDGWHIGIRHPWDASKVAWVVRGTDLAIATSGTYERGHHVIDPYRGAPATYLRSVTVTGADLGVADAFATAAMAMGERGLAWLAVLDRDGYASAAVTESGEAFRSDGFPAV